MWTRLTEENPQHSAAYIQRFKDLAAAGHDLVGEARLVDAMLFGIPRHDPVAFAVVLGVLAGAVLLASYLPARRAMRIDAAAMLRSD